MTWVRVVGLVNTSMAVYIVLLAKYAKNRQISDLVIRIKKKRVISNHTAINILWSAQELF